MEPNQLNKMKPKKQIRNFEKNFSKQTMEEINDIIRDHLIPTSMWDSENIAVCLGKLLLTYKLGNI